MCSQVTKLKGQEPKIAVDAFKTKFDFTPSILKGIKGLANELLPAVPTAMNAIAKAANSSIVDAVNLAIHLAGVGCPPS